MMCAQSGGVIVALALPLVSGWLSQFLSLQSSYMVTTGVLAIVMVATLFWASTQVVERIKVTSHEDPPGFKDVIYQLTHNKYVVLMFLLFFGVYGFNTVQSSSGVYYMTYFAMRPDMVAWFSMMNVLPSVVGVAVVPWLIRNFRKRGTVMLGLTVGAAGALLLGLLPATDPRFLATLDVIGRELRDGDLLFRYRHEDDFGTPQTAFATCAFWYVNALAAAGFVEEAREHFTGLLRICYVIKS